MEKLIPDDQIALVMMLLDSGCPMDYAIDVCKLSGVQPHEIWEAFCNIEEDSLNAHQKCVLYALKIWATYLEADEQGSTQVTSLTPQDVVNKFIEKENSINIENDLIYDAYLGKTDIKFITFSEHKEEWQG